MAAPTPSALVLVSALLVTGAAAQPSSHEGDDGDSVRPPACVVRAAMRWEAAVLPTAGRLKVQAEASAIWRRLGVDLRWSLEAVDKTMTTVSIVVIDHVERHRPEGPVARLGFVEFGGDGPSNELFVSAGAAMAVVSDSRWRLGVLADKQEWLAAVALRLLGRAVAHELGHYLLAARGHARYGLMRHRFTVLEAISPSLDRYGLTEDQRRLLRRRLETLGS